MSEEAKAIVGMMNTYTEISPSGCGLKLFARGKLPWGSKASHDIGVETYDQGRYFCVTSRHLDGTPTTLREIGDAEQRTILSFAFGVDESGKEYRQPKTPTEIDDRELALTRSRAFRFHTPTDILSGCASA